MKDDIREIVSELSSEDQKLYMEEWFRGNYEDPVERCPYDEGEYIYIWGGPYDAYEELEGQFSGEVANELIEELADELTMESPNWTNKEKLEDYVDIVEPNPEYYDNFQQGIKKIEEILIAKTDIKIRPYLLKLLYVNLITLLETYLSEAFITCVLSDKEHIINFVSKNKDFQKLKIKLSDIYKEHNNIEHTIQKYLSDIIWHRLDKVEQIFKCTFNIKFDKKDTMYKAIKIRHDLVHRSGKKNNGEKIDISEMEFNSIKENIVDFISTINAKLHT